MLIRVDDFPCGERKRFQDPLVQLEDFASALDCPFLLAVTPAQMSEIDMKQLYQWIRRWRHPVEVAVHGWTHGEGEFATNAVTKMRRAQQAFFPHMPRIMVPPYNCHTQKLLYAAAAVGFTGVTSGPETSAEGLDYGGLAVVPSVRYGHSHDLCGAENLTMGPQDVMTLHFTWELTGTSVKPSLSRLASMIRASVLDWGTLRFTENLTKLWPEEPSLHATQKMAYAKLFRWVDMKGLRALDFGPGCFSLPALMAAKGADVYWKDRDPRTPAWQADHQRRLKVTTQMAQNEAKGFDLVVASNSLQHNQEWEPEFTDAVSRVRPGGLIFLAEKTEPVTRWITNREDPCWARSLEEYFAAFGKHGLQVEAASGFLYVYDPNPFKEAAWWVDESRAREICMLLRKRA